MRDGRFAFSSLGNAARVIWAKSGDEGGHGLLAHLLDVAAVVETLLANEPAATIDWAAANFGVPRANAARWIAALAGLHDFGKAIPGFQAKWPEGMVADKESGLAFPASACSRDRHDLATAALLGKELHGRKIGASAWIRHVVQAISAHHGYHFLSDETNQGKPLNEPATWSAARADLLAAYWGFLAPAGGPSLESLSLPAVNWLAGLTSAADWIASNPDWFPLGERGFDFIEDYYRNARERAVVALDRIGWRASRPLTATTVDIDSAVARIIGASEVVARPLQRTADELLGDIDGPALLLVEAPMGEGKTELAFLAHLRLQGINGHRGLYVALPTQATGNAMFRRALTFLSGFASGPLDVQLIHGGAAMNADASHLRAVHLRGIDEDQDEALSASAWFAQRKRSLLSPYGIGTVDQALFAVLNVKHHFVRLWGLSNRVVVLDEVHAYDTYTSGLIAALVKWLRMMGCSVVLMSATLPARRRAELLQAWGAPGDSPPDLPYPRVLVTSERGTGGAHFAARPLAPIAVHGIDESLDSMAERALDLIEGGGCGAIIVNTVDRAQRLYTAIKDRLGSDTKRVLFHARFPADDRALREQTVLDWFGTGPNRPGRALLIATQVAEQSLDIDFDFLISDLAPVDLILQRAGRLHRHQRSRPKRHEQACLWVAGLQVGILPELKETAWGYVYDPHLLLRTWALLRPGTELEMPGDIDRLVQAVYGDEPLPDDLSDEALRQIEIETYGEYLARLQKERRESLNIVIDPTAEPQAAYRHKPRGNEEGDGVGLENRTRLGREAVTLIPVHVDAEGWRVQPGDVVFSPALAIPDDLARQLSRRQVKVSRTAIVKRFKSIAVPPAFEHPLLRNCYPLPLSAARYDEGGLVIVLDEDLGLILDASKVRDKK